MPAYALQGSMENRSEANGPQGSGVTLEVMFTPNTTDKHSVVITDGEDIPVSTAAGQLSMFLLEAPPASPSALQDSERDWLTRVATSCLPTLPLLAAIGPDGWSGRTSPASCPLIADGILAPSSVGWQSAGMGSPTGFLTLNISDWPSDGSACSLSDVLETGDVPQRFYLSGKACRGILRRAEKRGKSLPPSLHAALLAVASAPTSTATED